MNAPPARPWRFSLPLEYGAWWTFEGCLGAGLLKVLAAGREDGLALSLTGGIQALFFASEWLTGFGTLENRRSWKAWQFWLLAAIGGGLLGRGLTLASAPLRTELCVFFLIWGLCAGCVLWMRMRMQARDLRLLMVSAVLLTGPMFLAGLLLFQGDVPKTLASWGLWAWFFPWGVFYIRTWIAGNTLPHWRIWMASVPLLIEATALACYSGLLGRTLLLLLCLHMFWRLKTRLKEFREYGGRPYLASSAREIRFLGYEQLAWSLVLGGIWIAN